MRRTLAVLIALASLTALLTGCAASPSDTPQVQLQLVSPLPQQDNLGSEERPVLRLAVASMVSPGRAVEAYTQLANYLEGPLGGTVELVQRRTYAETYELLRSGGVDAAAVCTYVYILGHGEFGLEPVASPEVGGSATYQSLIIVRADSGIDTFAELRQKRFAFTDPLSTSGRLYPLSLLQKMGKTPESYFSSSSYTYSHDNSVLAVVEGVADAAAIDSLVYHQWAAAHPERAKGLKVLQSSPTYGSPPFVVPPSTPPDLRDRLQQALLSMHESDEGREVLRLLGAERFRRPSDADYDVVRQLAESLGMAP